MQHSLPKIVTHARSHCRQFFFFYTISGRSAGNFSISTDNFRDFAFTRTIVRQLRSKFFYFFLFSFVSPIFSNSKTLYTSLRRSLDVHVKKKRKKEIFRQFQIAILPKKILDFVPLVNTSLLPDTSRSLASHPRNSKLLHEQFHYRTVQSPKGSFFSLLTGLTRLLVSIMIEPRLPQIRAIVHRRSDAIPGTLVQAENV